MLTRSRPKATESPDNSYYEFLLANPNQTFSPGVTATPLHPHSASNSHAVGECVTRRITERLSAKC